ncbi:MAG TPA: NAD(P)/FAD-dependent oxidoreductase, partial [Woeseiaceae bacterium]|nr:NAD(P)/FAD-dependent oxidoreductase [Woeseiaceae bacterium]
MTAMQRDVAIVGAGLCGPLLAVLLARRRFRVTLYERGDDPREKAPSGGRSINLALAARGIHALQRAGLMEAVEPLLLPMRGRSVHDEAGNVELLPYGQREHEVIHSVSRAGLNRVLVEAAAAEGVTLRFGHEAVGAETGSVRMRERASGREFRLDAPLIAADGAGSAVRRGLDATAGIGATESLLPHSYKELTLPPGAGGTFRLDPGALHIWPRGGFMLIALPNTDGSFTATLFLAREGSPSFAELTDAAAIRDFFAREFPGAVPLLPRLVEEFAENPQGRLGTVYSEPWHVGGKVLLLGDAAHAIVPFHGQGMNCAFEDVAVLDALLDEHQDFDALFGAFMRARRPDTDAIAQMALENYLEMRDTVLDPAFQRRKALG